MPMEEWWDESLVAGRIQSDIKVGKPHSILEIAWARAFDYNLYDKMKLPKEKKMDLDKAKYELMKGGVEVDLHSPSSEIVKKSEEPTSRSSLAKTKSTNSSVSGTATAVRMAPKNVQKRKDRHSSQDDNTDNDSNSHPDTAQRAQQKKVKLGGRSEATFRQCSHMFAAEEGNKPIIPYSIKPKEMPIGTARNDPDPARQIVATIDEQGTLMVYPVNLTKSFHGMEPTDDYEWQSRKMLAIESDEQLLENVVIAERLRNLSFTEIKMFVYDQIKEFSSADEMPWIDGTDLVDKKWLRDLAYHMVETNVEGFMRSDDLSLGTLMMQTQYLEHLIDGSQRLELVTKEQIDDLIQEDRVIEAIDVMQRFRQDVWVFICGLTDVMLHFRRGSMSRMNRPTFEFPEALIDKYGITISANHPGRIKSTGRDPTIREVRRRGNLA